jgi:hypothetical protein
MLVGKGDGVPGKTRSDKNLKRKKSVDGDVPVQAGISEKFVTVTVPTRVRRVASENRRWWRSTTHAVWFWVDWFRHCGQEHCGQEHESLEGWHVAGEVWT